MARDSREGLITEVLERLPTVWNRIEREVPDTFPTHIFDAIKTGMHESAGRLASMPAA
jgi:hypothetical protein